MRGDLPGSVLFACDRNAIRSAMAEAIMKHLFGNHVYVDSAGVQLNDTAADPFAISVMQEIGLDIAGHRTKTFEDLPDNSVDLIIVFTRQAQKRANEFTRTIPCKIEYWPLLHPVDVTGSREVLLGVYRDTRDAIFERIKTRFPTLDGLA